MDNHNQKIDNDTDTDKKTQKFLFCDKLLTSYVLCIHKFSIEHKDCNKIHHTLSNLELCKEQMKVLTER